MELLTDRLSVVQQEVYHPVCHSRLVQDDALLLSVYLLTVEMCEHDIFHIQDIRYRGNRRVVVRHVR